MNYYGLDYGTTTSLLYNYNEGKWKSVCITPSAVMTANGKVVKTGKDACNDSDRQTKCFIESPKSFINNLESQRNGVTYKAMIEATLSNMIKQEGNDIRNSHITLTVPNYYTAPNYKNMYSILTECLDRLVDNHKVEVHLIPEPVSAALYYVHKHISEIPSSCHLVICDIGGGTTDMCIVEFKKEGNTLSFKVLDGMQHELIGGNDFDKKLKQNMPLPRDRSDFWIDNFVKGVKSQLSFTEEVEQWGLKVRRSEFVSYIDDYIMKLRQLMEKMLEESKMKNAVDNSWYVIPIGGSCKIPAIRQQLKEVFNKANQVNNNNEDPEIFYSVAMGAAVYSAWCGNALKCGNYDEIKIVHHTPHAIMLKTVNEWYPIVKQNAPDGPHDDIVRLATIEEKGKGLYSVGKIMLSEKGTQYEWVHDRDFFSLKGRKPEEIKLQICIETKNCRIAKCWIKDMETGEKCEWALEEMKNTK